ncbi:MAG: hypothetical protein CR978_02105 [Gammaproteobacteria bacterium]|nr:MAG: hypothetical protein CR978_02105 [Gammaproteobacteria bacterium]PIE39067.1 MAG: hypothetical protein CSA53_03425 [Gammaproteobacteria bacterium]
MQGMSYHGQIPKSELPILQLEILLESISRAGFIGHTMAMVLAGSLFWPYVSGAVIVVVALVVVILLVVRHQYVSYVLREQRFRTHFKDVYRNCLLGGAVLGLMWSVAYLVSAHYHILPQDPQLHLFVLIITIVGGLVALSVVMREYFLVFTYCSVWPIAWYLIVNYDLHTYNLFMGVLGLLFCAVVTRLSLPVHESFNEVLSAYWERENMSRELGELTVSLRERNRELNDAKQRLTQLARLDELTGLGNRRMVNAVITDELNRARRVGSALSLILLDVDFFKKYNDTYGHPEGDYVLRTLACMMRQVVSRAGEVAARYGGEEFVLVLPGSDADAARAVAQRLQKMVALEAMEHKTSDVADVVTLSQGLVTYYGRGEVDAEQLLKAADDALYEAKANGRMCIVSTHID